MEWAAAEAERAIHDNKVDRLAQLLREYPALLSWRSDSGESLLSLATGSFGDSGDPSREQAFTRIACAEFLLDAGAAVEPRIWEGAISSRAKGVLQLLLRKGGLSINAAQNPTGAGRFALPRTLDVLAALGYHDGVRDCLESTAGGDAAAVTQAFLVACRFQHKAVAALLLNRSIELDPALGERVERWRGRSAFIDYLAEHPVHGSPWRTVVMNELEAAMRGSNLEEFNRWLQREPDLLCESDVVGLIEIAAYNDWGPFIARLIELNPVLKVKRPPSSAVLYALEYGNAHLIPLLTPVWPLPDDLPHAAGVGDFARVKGWFDEAGRPRLGSLSQHHPTNHPSTLRNLHWMPPNAQHVLDVALAWACMNRQFEIADFLLEHGANVNTDWSTHEPASILHECAIRGNYEAAQFLIDHGIDMTICDYRWNGTAEGWAIHAYALGQPPVNDQNMAEFLARAERARKKQSR
jgi:ankyrin repeat protein